MQQKQYSTQTHNQAHTERSYFLFHIYKVRMQSQNTYEAKRVAEANAECIARIEKQRQPLTKIYDELEARHKQLQEEKTKLEDRNKQLQEEKRKKALSLLTPTYIDEGSFGCVYEPAFQCGTQQRQPNTISKVFRSVDQRDIEYKKHDAITQFDKNGEFTVQIVCTSKIERRDINQVYNGQKPCSLLSKLDKLTNLNYYLYQIVYKHAGVSLYKAAKNTNFNILMKSLSHIFEGLVTLTTNNVLHMDIKPQNICFNSDTNKSVLIDWGNASTWGAKQIQFIQNYIHARDFQYAYFIYPPEFPIHYNQLVRTFRQPGPQIPVRQNSNNFVNHIRYYTNQYTHTHTQSLFNDIVHMHTSSQLPIHTIIDHTKIDVYALGVTITLALAMNIHKKPPKTQITMDFYKNVLSMCKAMVQPDPARRINAAEAHTRYRQLTIPDIQ